MTQAFIDHVRAELAGVQEAGLYKAERVITSPQAGTVELDGGRKVINLCANNYLGLSDHPELVAEGQRALAAHGYGMSSVRFICGTQDVHKALEARISAFLGFEDTILFASCFDANTGLFETVLEVLDHLPVTAVCRGRQRVATKVGRVGDMRRLLDTIFLVNML